MAIARAVPRGAILSADDLSEVEVEATRLPEDAIRDPAFAVGHRTRRALRAGAILRSAQVEIPPVVSRGDPVDLVYRRGPLSIRMRGRARQDGRLGERIRVQTAASRRDLVGRVAANGSLVVED